MAGEPSGEYPTERLLKAIQHEKELGRPGAGMVTFVDVALVENREDRGEWAERISREMTKAINRASEKGYELLDTFGIEPMLVQGGGYSEYQERGIRFLVFRKSPASGK